MIDADAGTVEDPSETSVDLLPANLIDRCFGLLRANCDDDKLGLAAVISNMTKCGRHQPRPARKNLHIASATLEAIAACYEKSFQRFMDIPRY